MNVTKKSYVLSPAELGWIIDSYPPNSKASFESTYHAYPDKFTLEIFRDMDLNSYKGVFFYFAGGSGNWEVPLTSPLVDIAKDGWIVANWSAMKQNYPLNVNAFSTWRIHNYKHWGSEVNCAIEMFYKNVVPELFPNLPCNLSGYVFGHSRGAGAVTMWGGYDPSERTAYACNIKGIGSSSPAGGTHTQPYVSLRAFTSTAQQVTLPTVITVGAGDLTHTTRPYIERINPIITNPLTSIHVLGDENNKHNSFNNDYLMWFNFCRPIIDSYYE